MFPRFYFIGDDDLLEILGQSTNTVVIQSHLKKLFAGIHNVEFDEGFKNIIAMKSLKGEVVPLKRSVAVTTEVEVLFVLLSKNWFLVVLDLSSIFYSFANAYVCCCEIIVLDKPPFCRFG